MIKMIENLILNEFAYLSKGHVLFNIKKFPEYGSLSNRTLDEMISGSRVEIADYKINPGDFVLWKPSEKNIPVWESPWGRGRPGWHIECSAMSKKYLIVSPLNLLRISDILTKFFKDLDILTLSIFT